MRLVQNNLIRGKIRFDNEDRFEFSDLNLSEYYKCDDLEIVVEENEYNDYVLGKIKIKLENSYFKENHYLAKNKPIQLYLPVVEIPEKITSFHLFLPWWTRPEFSNSLGEIPDKTQLVLFKYKDSYGCLLPMIGNTFKATVNKGTDDEIGIELTALIGGQRELNEPLYIYATGSSVEEAIKKVFEGLSEETGLKLREQRRYPEIFRYLGWWSWDAVYTDVDEKAIRDKSKELTDKDIPIRWMIIDDGWMDTEGEFLRDFEPEKTKFPNGFSQLSQEIKDNSPVEEIGVWHALGGYWNGIKSNSPLTEKENEYLLETTNGKIVPSPSNGTKFYRDWYKHLAEQGIDFVKVDNQSSIASFSENTLPLTQATKGMQQSLEEGAVIFDNKIINCMGMAMENIVFRPSSAISRNSNDFFPKDENSFAEHLIENAYNALFHNEVFYCDWDMFWTTHKHNLKHSLLRALSGGPVYISDKINETKPEILEPLSYIDGEILMMDRSAKPTFDCVFIDPLKEGVLKLQNTAPYGRLKGGVIAAFNLTDSNQEYSFKPPDISGITIRDSYWVYNFFTNECTIIKQQELFKANLASEDFAYFIILPKEELGNPLGLIKKFVGFTSVEDIIENKNNLSFIVKETGSFGWLSEKVPKKVILNGENIMHKVERKGFFYSVNIEPSNSKMSITIYFD